ncbi:hypothetical protein AAG570_012991 [Ranatra chinensis]|uniref:Phosphatidylinositol glycan anchor biosynthesis class U protein n=1 Tax=Ranatra chinensis TaxID=642074 RepID=A0ABD0YXX5_9HEMI
MGKSFCSQFVVAIAIRLILINSSYQKGIAERVEISTLLNSWKRVTEGVALYQEGIDPYTGDIFHETPIALMFLNFLITNIPQAIGCVFVFCDILTAYILYLAATVYMKETFDKQKKEMANYAKGIYNLLLNENDFNTAPIYVMSVYLFNPFTILNCVAFTSTTFANLFLSIVYLSMVKGYRICSCLALGLAVLQSFYPIVLIVPVCMYISQNSYNKVTSVILTLSVFVYTMMALLYLSYCIIGDWKFIHSIYVAILTVPDLRPNIGLFWYFFTEMFEHFRVLFIFSFQLNATLLYLAPLSLRFHSDPLLLATNMQQSFIIACSIVVTTVLGPTVWHLWIYSRSANANFYFGVTLAFATSQIFLITDLLFSYIKRDFYLKYGVMDGDERVKLKLLLE